MIQTISSTKTGVSERAPQTHPSASQCYGRGDSRSESLPTQPGCQKCSRNSPPSAWQITRHGSQRIPAAARPEHPNPQEPSARHARLTKASAHVAVESLRKMARPRRRSRPRILKRVFEEEGEDENEEDLPLPLANAPSTLNPQLIFTSCPFSLPSPLRASRIACYPLRICCACNSSPRISTPGPHRCTSISSFALAGILCGSDRPAAG